MSAKPIKFYRTSVEGRKPDPKNLQEGEIALNLFAGKEKIFIKNSNNEVASFISEPEISQALNALLQLVDTKLNKASYEGYNVVTMLNDIPIDKRLVFANIGTNSQFSLLGVPLKGEEVHVIIKNTGSSTISIPIPNAGTYVSTGEDILNILPGKYGEISTISDGTKIYLRSL